MAELLRKTFNNVLLTEMTDNYYLIQNSQAVKKSEAPKEAMVKKEVKIQGGGQEIPLSSYACLKVSGRQAVSQ